MIALSEQHSVLGDLKIEFLHWFLAAECISRVLHEMSTYYVPLVVLAPPEYHPAVRQMSRGCFLQWMLAAGCGNINWSEFEHGKHSSFLKYMSRVLLPLVVIAQSSAAKELSLRDHFHWVLATG